MTDAQTEARAIETVRDWLNGGCSSWGLPSQEIETLLTALAAKDAELAAMKVSNNKWLAKWERAEAALAEARKALEPFAEIAGEPWADENGWTNAACQNDRICDWFGPSAFRTARRALTGDE